VRAKKLIFKKSQDISGKYFQEIVFKKGQEISGKYFQDNTRQELFF